MGGKTQQASAPDDLELGRVLLHMVTSIRPELFGNGILQWTICIYMEGIVTLG